MEDDDDEELWEEEEDDHPNNQQSRIEFRNPPAPAPAPPPVPPRAPPLVQEVPAGMPALISDEDLIDILMKKQERDGLHDQLESPGRGGAAVAPSQVLPASFLHANMTLVPVDTVLQQPGPGPASVYLKSPQGNGNENGLHLPGPPVWMTQSRNLNEAAGSKNPAPNIQNKGNLNTALPLSPRPGPGEGLAPLARVGPGTPRQAANVSPQRGGQALTGTPRREPGGHGHGDANLKPGSGVAGLPEGRGQSVGGVTSGAREGAAAADDQRGGQQGMLSPRANGGGHFRSGREEGPLAHPNGHHHFQVRHDHHDHSREQHQNHRTKGSGPGAEGRGGAPGVKSPEVTVSNVRVTF